MTGLKSLPAPHKVYISWLFVQCLVQWSHGLKRQSKGTLLRKAPITRRSPHITQRQKLPRSSRQKRGSRQGCSGFQKNQLTSSKSLLRRCVSSEPRHFPDHPKMAKWFDANVHNLCPSPHKTSTAVDRGLSSLWGASSLLLCWLEVKLLMKRRQKPLGSWQLSYWARTGWERGLNNQIQPQDRITQHARNE